MNEREWAERVVLGVGGLHSWEEHEHGHLHVDRDVAAVMWALRCLANPRCEGSDVALAAITQKHAGSADGPETEEQAAPESSSPSSRRSARRPEDVLGIDRRYLELYGPFDSLRALGRHVGLRDFAVGAEVRGKYVDLALDKLISIAGITPDEERAELVIGLMEGALEGLAVRRGGGNDLLRRLASGDITVRDYEEQVARRSR